jgi:hypothetical protein
LFLRQALLLGAQHFFGPQGFGQLRAALIALCDSQAKECFEPEMEHGSEG